jgi:hemerythrin-like metal-binding protein
MMPNAAANDARMIDAEHQIQIQLLNELRRVLREGGDGAELRERLADYCRAHFLSEELLMRLHAYPDYDDHVGDHEQLLDALDGLVEPGQADAMAAFLLRHIGERDSRLHGYLDRV